MRLNHGAILPHAAGERFDCRSIWVCQLLSLAWGISRMRFRTMLTLIVCVSCSSSLLTPHAGIAGPNNGGQGNKVKLQANKDKPQVTQYQPQATQYQSQVSPDKAQEAYNKHIKEAEQERRRQEQQAKGALFKSNVRKALEHGRAQQHH